MHISCLWIPQSFGDGLPRPLRPALRELIGYHQYQLLLSVTSLHGKLPMPPPPPPPRFLDSFVRTKSLSAWFGVLRPGKNQPNLTAKTALRQVHFSQCEMALTQIYPLPSLHHPTGYTPHTKAAPFLKKFVQSRPISHSPYTAHLKAFASSHYAYLQVCFTPHCSPPQHASEFQSNALEEYEQLAHILNQHQC